MSRPNTASTQIGIHEVYCVECGAETELDCICDDLNFADRCECNCHCNCAQYPDGRAE